MIIYSKFNLIMLILNFSTKIFDPFIFVLRNKTMQKQNEFATTVVSDR